MKPRWQCTNRGRIFQTLTWPRAAAAVPAGGVPGASGASCGAPRRTHSGEPAHLMHAGLPLAEQQTGMPELRQEVQRPARALLHGTEARQPHPSLPAPVGPAAQRAVLYLQSAQGQKNTGTGPTRYAAQSTPTAQAHEGSTTRHNVERKAGQHAHAPVQHEARASSPEQAPPQLQAHSSIGKGQSKQPQRAHRKDGPRGRSWAVPLQHSECISARSGLQGSEGVKRKAGCSRTTWADRTWPCSTAECISTAPSSMH